MTSSLKRMAIAAAVLSFSVLNGLAQEGDTVIDMNAVDCRTMLKMDSDEQDFTLIYFHGYVSGTRGETMFNGPALREATNAIMDYCIDSPSATVMEAFEKNR